MKLNKWLYGAAALAMLAACSDKDIAPGSDPNGGEITFKQGKTYLGISLELPSEPETRAADDGNQGNDNYDDGISEEYNVDNAALLLFIGDNEADAQFIGAYELVPDDAFDQPNGDNVTVSFQQAAQLMSQPEFSSQLWGLAIVNYKTDHFEITTSEDSNYGNLKIRTSTRKDEDGNVSYQSDLVSIARKTNTSDGAKFSDIRAYITDCSFLSLSNNGELDGIFMTNAPLSDKQGTTVAVSSPTIQTLAKLQKNFEKTKLDAVKNPAGCIFVERAVAKVTCSYFPEKAVLKHTTVTNADTGAASYDEEDVEIEIESVDWMIDNEEQSSYIIRNTTGIDNTTWSLLNNNWQGNPRYRFIGGVSMNDYAYDGNTKGHTWYRTYWCEDPAYATKKDFYDQANKSPNFKATTNALYPHENTFTVANQNYKNTTRVIFKVKYSSTGTVKGKDGAANKMITNCNLFALRNQLKTFYLESDVENLFYRTVLGSTELHDLILELLSDEYKATATPDGKTLSVDYGKDDIIISINPAAADDTDHKIVKGDYIVNNITFAGDLATKLDMSKLTETQLKNKLDKIMDSANTANHVVPFTDNTCYYAAYIQHFGKTYCPLSDEVAIVANQKDWKGEDVNTVYPGLDAGKYLGRYGMVRNNWYDLNVDIIGNLGNATVPNGNVETSDDNKKDEWFISARIHVLSWAKRTQHTSF